MPAQLPQRIDGLVSGDRIDPGPDGAPFFVQATLQVDLEERILENVFGQGAITEVAGQVAIELVLVTLDQGFEVRPESRYRLRRASSGSWASSSPAPVPVALIMTTYRPGGEFEVSSHEIEPDSR
jgi:hypothetical protein